MTVEQTYLALLRSALWGTDMPVIDKLEEILDLADRQKTRGLVYDVLLRKGTGIPRQTADRMQQLFYLTLNTHNMLDAAVARSMAALHDAEIPAVLLKGQAAARYYPNPPLRECGDIDIYVGPERLEDAVRVLTPVTDRRAEAPKGLHWKLWMDKAEIELHDHTMLPETRRQARFYRTLEDEGLRHGLVPLDFSGVRVDTPEDTFCAFYLFYHAWHHFVSGGIGFRQLCDWALMLHARQDRIDRECLRAMLDGMGLTGPWQLFGCIAVHDLGLPREEFPFYDDSRPRAYRRALRLILSEGNFGQGRKMPVIQPGNYPRSKIYYLFAHARRFFQVLPVAPREAVSIFRSIYFNAVRKLIQDTPRQ